MIDVTSADNELDEQEKGDMELFLGTKLAEYFVGLTFKLASMGKTGAVSLPYAQLHTEAKWIFSAATEDENVQINWDLVMAGGRRLGLH